MGLLLPALAILTAVAVLAVLWPVFRRRPIVPRGRFELAIYRDQLTEVERDRERGLIPGPGCAWRTARDRAAPAPGDRVDTPPVEAGAGRRIPLIAAAVLVPLFATTLYAILGSPQLPDQPLASRHEPPSAPVQPDVTRWSHAWRPASPPRRTI